MAESSADDPGRALEDLIHAHAVHMGLELPRTARFAEKEEEVRIRGARLIEDFVEAADIKVRKKYEYGLAGGSIDSKYGGVIVEYKNPKGQDRIELRKNASGTKAVIQQIKGRFEDFQTEEGINPNRLFGVGLDGQNVVFVRHRGGKFDIGSPQPVNANSIKRLLRALVSLGARGHSFTPANLTRDFGADSAAALKGVAEIYEVVATTKNPKAKTFFQQWKILFGEVCGYDVEGRSAKIQKLASHYEVKNAKPAELLFSVHTYYAILMKFLAAEIVSSFSPLGISVLKRCAAAPSDEALLREMEKLEHGGIWSDLGITNFLEGDLFSWYLAAWNERMASVVRDLAQTLDDYDPSTLSVEPAESRDLLKHLYQHLFPKSVRHDLGEYYTPDWLAEHVLDEMGYDGNPDKRLLDPACGSGTFLVMAINRVKEWFEENRDQCGFAEKHLLEKILRNIVGFDLNPLAVMAARVNYLLAIRDLLRESRTVELPVYLCDSILTPAEYGTLFARGKQLKTSVGEFIIPAEIVERRTDIGKYAENLERCIRDGYTAKEFVERCQQDGLPVKELATHVALYDKLLALDEKNQNGIWARILKNAFAPLFVGKFNFVAGNPPWINWESLPNDYRDDLKSLWQRYGLFTLTGSAGRLGGGKKDLSMLFVYTGIDRYLEDGDRLGFVITQTVFKTKGAGDGFRRLQFEDGKHTIRLKPVIVDDLSSIKIFEGAMNRTAVFVCERQKTKFDYPVTYRVWKGRSTIDQDVSLEEVQTIVDRVSIQAIPVTKGRRTSPWLTAPGEALTGIKKILGNSPYTAHAGVYSGGLNGCFWLRVLENRGDGTLFVENLHDVGKKKVPHVQTAIEADLVYPLFRGRDVDRWRAKPSASFLLTQDPKARLGIPVKEMKRRFKRTYSYLKNFEKQLGERSSSSIRRLMDKGPFYSIFAVGSYTMAPFKVMWPELGHTVQAAVWDSVSREEEKPALPEHTVVYISCRSSNEAHFLCAMLNSAPAQAAFQGFVVLHPSPHVMQNVAVPRFNVEDDAHLNLADLSRKSHVAVQRGDKAELERYEGQIDAGAAKIWGIPVKQLRTIQKSLIDT